MSRKWRKAKRGLGEGLAKVGELLFTAELQKMRDMRLAQISEQAAAAREAGENARLDKRIAAEKDLADTKHSRDLEIAKIGASAKADKDKWKVTTNDTGDIIVHNENSPGEFFNMSDPDDADAFRALQLRARGLTVEDLGNAAGGDTPLGADKGADAGSAQGAPGVNINLSGALRGAQDWTSRNIIEGGAGVLERARQFGKDNTPDWYTDRQRAKGRIPDSEPLGQ